MNKKDVQRKIIKFEKLEYLWHNKTWIKLYNNCVVSTSLAQKLTNLAIKENLLTLEDIKQNK